MVMRAELTEAEWAVASRMSNEKRTTEGVAYELGVGESTVRKHLERVYKKLGVKSRREMAIALCESTPKNRTMVFGVYL